MLIKLSALAIFTLLSGWLSHAPIKDFKAIPPIHVKHSFASATPAGLTPTQVKNAYKLPASGGAGKTIAIVDAYDNPTIAADLNAFSTTQSLPLCDPVSNPCFKEHKMSSGVSADSGWSLESALDVEWAHAIAPQATVLLVEANSASGTDLLNAVDYARAQSGVIAVSMSWGGREFSGETSYDGHFSGTGISFFASSGDSGHGVSWPAVSSNVTAVGGTTLSVDATGHVLGETAWSGSGGGISRWVNKPSYQSFLSGKHRGIPDVSYDADPATGFPVYSSTYNATSGWWQVGGTSAGAPQWAAIMALGGASASNTSLYSHVSNPAYYRDIISGSNGGCGSVCTATSGYDYVTGLGSPLTTTF